MSPGRTPSRRRAEAAVLFGTAAVVFAADQVTKALVVANIDVGQRIDVIGDLVQLWHAENSGAAFSLLQNGQLLFVVVSIFALALITYFFRSLHGRSLGIFVLLGLVLGGTLGNFTDRLRHAQVTDFVSVGIGELRWPTFNVADSSIVMGILAFVVLLTLFDGHDRSGERSGASPERGA
jgi:signal peptidase II